MKISTKGRYGLRAMLDIAQNASGKPIALKDIAARQDISELYLEQVFSILKKAGLLKSVKGSQGGYFLNNRPSEITVEEVLKVLEGELSVIDKKSGKQSDLQTFLYETLWREIDEKIYTLMSKTTLRELIDEYNCSDGENSTMYYI